MIEKTKGIVLKVVKYRESSAIVEILTENLGLKSYIINGIYAKKPKFPPSMIQPGSVLDMVVYNRENKNINRVKELKASWHPGNSLQSLQHMAVKSFIIEFVQKIMRYEESNSSFYGELENTLFFIEHKNQTVTNVPIYFLSRMVELLGLSFDLEEWPSGHSLDLRTGERVSSNWNHPMLIKENLIQYFYALQKLDLTRLEELQIQSAERSEIFKYFLNYLSFHINNFPHLYTPEIYKQLL